MNRPDHILIVDDDAEIRKLLARYLGEQGFYVSLAQDRRDYEKAMEASHPDLIVLDVMLPDGSGLDICRGLYDHMPHIPVILLTALKEDVDRIIGLELGADDYIGKPFNPRELVARIRSVLRRSQNVVSEARETVRYRFGAFVLDARRRSVTREDGSEVDLTGAEFDLLLVFVERAGRLLSRDQLLDLTARRNRDPFDRSIDVMMSKLRRKLSEGEAGAIFKTVRNGGYQLTLPVSSVPENR